MTECLACSVNQGDPQPPGGVLYDDGLWRLDHAVQPTPLLGWLVAKPLRHVEFLDDLTDTEAEVMGQVLRRAVAALRSTLVPSPVKVYTAFFAESERCPHVHFHIIPRGVDDPPGLRGPRVFDRMRLVTERPEQEPSLQALEDLARRVRQFLADPKR